MRERPILLNAEMVRAVLDGRKTQTRRVMKVQPESNQFGLLRITDSTKRSDIGKYHWAESNATGTHTRSALFSCPFGAVGDRLWVREKTRVDLLLSNRRAHVRYEADGAYRIVPVPERIKPVADGRCMSNGCYREASRITLEITGVRVERLQDISEKDARAEGYPANRAADGGNSDPWLWFRDLWDGIYPEQSFKANPWVWVIEFKRVEGE